MSAPRLLVDIGNSRVKWALARDGQLVDTGVCAHLDARWWRHLPGTRPDSIWAANVAGHQRQQALDDWAGQTFSQTVNWARSTATACGLRNAYAQPQRLGVDRWLAMIAAYHRCGGPVLVADAGTALTIDQIAADGRHLGGLICPGIASMQQALVGRTQLEAPQLPVEDAWLATHTDAAIALGSLRAAVALLDNSAAALAPAHRLMTGGEAAMLAPHLAQDWQVTPHLVLEGLLRLSGWPR